MLAQKIADGGNPAAQGCAVGPGRKPREGAGPFEGFHPQRPRFEQGVAQAGSQIPDQPRGGGDLEVLEDAAGRVTRREVRDVRRAVDKILRNGSAAEFRQWLERFYADDWAPVVV